MQKDIAKEILRLHVVANSDSKKDQALKMEVKEAVVTYLRGVMQDAESVDEARIQIQKRLPEISLRKPFCRGCYGAAQKSSAEVVMISLRDQR